MKFTEKDIVKQMMKVLDCTEEEARKYLCLDDKK